MDTREITEEEKAAANKRIVAAMMKSHEEHASQCDGVCFKSTGVIESATLVIVELMREAARLQRACDEGLPREAIFCPECGKRHIEGPRHDDPSVDGRKRPHHTHRCYHCGNVWDSGRWSFGVAPGQETR